MAKSLIKLLQQSIQSHWSTKALSDYHGDDFTYGDIAHIIDDYHGLFHEYGIQRGDHIALCGNGCARWGIAFMAVVSYGAVAVPILTGFTPQQIQDIVTHSESRLLFASASIRSVLDISEMPLLENILNLEDIQHPVEYKLAAADIDYQEEMSPEDLVMLNYTSGTTGFSKGVMLPYRSFCGNFEFFQASFGHIMKAETPHLSILPLAHMYGLTLEFICPFLNGCHVTFLCRTPSPAILMQALSDIHPRIVMAVPLIIEKLAKQTVLPLVKKSRLGKIMHWPVVGMFARQYLHYKLLKAFGGKLCEVISGGAAINRSIEQTLRDLKFPLTEAYGATECGPMISFSDYKKKRQCSCGTAVTGMELRIDSTDPHNVAGEILARGQNTMLGYYKNPEATAMALDEDGWYHTGDNGVIDADGYLFIRGRKKNMLLGSNGQNIYPEEIEDQLNTLLLVSESIVVQRDGRLVALVYPDYDEANELGLSDENVRNIMKLNTTDINELVPAYEQIHHIEIHEVEFEKTAKKTLKRYLYK